MYGYNSYDVSLKWDFNDALEYLRRGRNKTNRPFFRKSGTRVVYRGAMEPGYESIALQYWSTDVVRWYRSTTNKKNQWFSVDAQYDSPSTQRRIRQCVSLGSFWRDKATNNVLYGEYGHPSLRDKEVENKPVIADHHTWFKREKGTLKIRHRKRCEARRDNLLKAWTKTQTDRYYEQMNRQIDAATRKTKLLEDWMTKGSKKKKGHHASNLKRKPGIPAQLANFGEKTVEETLREIEMFKNRVAAARNAALSEEQHYIDLPERYETTKRLVYLRNEEERMMVRLSTIASYNEMLQKKKELNLEIRKLTSHKVTLNSLEEAEKQRRETSNKVYSLKSEVHTAERTIQLAKTITTIHQANKEKLTLISEVDALKEELNYLLKMKEGTTPEGIVDFLNRL